MQNEGEHLPWTLLLSSAGGQVPPRGPEGGASTGGSVYARTSPWVAPLCQDGPEGDTCDPGQAPGAACAPGRAWGVTRGTQMGPGVP